MTKQIRPEYNREYQLRRYHQRIGRARDILGGKCVKCGTDANLEIDHIDWRTKTMKSSALWSSSEDKYTKELALCQLLCKSCHLEKTKQDLREHSQEKKQLD